ncbi:MAG TPA: hypothetical protein VF228_04640 [Iamia sp.]
MTVEKGVDWGGTGPVPDDLVVVHTDAEARAAVVAARTAGRPLPTLGLLGGDLARTLGGRGGDPARLRESGTLATVDLGVAVLDGDRHPFVAHLVARRSWWRGRVVAVMNAQFLGAWDVAPRAHPGDGRLDVLDGDLGPGDRWKARTRLPAGTHVPHPGIAQRRAEAWSTTLDRPTPIRLDGEVVATARTVAVEIEPDTLRVVV